MDALSRQSAVLPPIGHLDEYHRRKEEHASVMPESRSGQISPASDYRGPPPPPYSQATSNPLQSASAPVSEQLGDAKRESDAAPPAPLRSLPSIHEALGATRSPPRQNYVAGPARSYYSYTSPTSPRSATSLPSSDVRSEQERVPGLPSYIPSGGPSYSSSDPHRPEPHRPEHRLSGPLPPASAPSSASAHQTSYQASPSSHPPPHHPWQPSHVPNDRQYAPPDQQYAYGPSGHSSFAHPPPPSSAAQANGAPPVHYVSSLHADGSGRVEHPAHAGELKPLTDYPGLHYNENVKRHLDTFDLESALNEIGDASRSLIDFSGHYCHRAHQTARSGPLPGSTPHLSEIDEMAKHAHRISSSLLRLREVVLSQQAALAERSKEALVKTTNVAPEDHAQANQKDGFAGADPKKRRGRAAPPGRCHSCNRAETPEWRRGPDGARTLCNACGLHYAKLTRKMQSNKGPGSSNLKPKMSSTSPTA